MNLLEGCCALTIEPDGSVTHEETCEITALRKRAETAEQQLAAAQAALLKAREALRRGENIIESWCDSVNDRSLASRKDEIQTREWHTSQNWFEEFSDFIAAKQPLSALREFVISILPKRCEVQLEDRPMAQGFNQAIEQTEANLSKALGPK